MKTTILLCAVLLLFGCGGALPQKQPGLRIYVPDLTVTISVAPSVVPIVSSTRSPSPRITYTITARNIGDPTTLQGVEVRFYPYRPVPVEAPVIFSGGDFSCQPVFSSTFGVPDDWYIKCISGNFSTTNINIVIEMLAPSLPAPFAGIAWIDPSDTVTESNEHNNLLSALVVATP